MEKIDRIIIDGILIDSIVKKLRDDRLKAIELMAVLEAARIALVDAKIAEEVGERVGLTCADINNLQNKVHRFLEANNYPNERQA